MEIRHPFCREHRYTMTYDPSAFWWVCPVGGETVSREEIYQKGQSWSRVLATRATSRSEVPTPAAPATAPPSFKVVGWMSLSEMARRFRPMKPAPFLRSAIDAAMRDGDDTICTESIGVNDRQFCRKNAHHDGLHESPDGVSWTTGANEGIREFWAEDETEPQTAPHWLTADVEMTPEWLGVHLEGLTQTRNSALALVRKDNPKIDIRIEFRDGEVRVTPFNVHQAGQDVAHAYATGLADRKRNIIALLNDDDVLTRFTNAMSDHVQSHQNSNNPNAWGCDGRCASQAALRIVSKIIHDYGQET